MKTLSNEDIVDEFLDHIRYFRVAHHVRGRIRVKALWRSLKDLRHVDKEQLQEVVAKIPGILDYRINLKALSAVIEYDPGILPPSLWDDVASLENYPLKRDEVRSQLLTLLG
ncbi:MAG: hypothetical protein CSA20_07775 [Deltaproteobacteria bacterium]|nr:MAG: hypothetical protein CSA20_07775 [Deltaproteobacteria bacterium]